MRQSRNANPWRPCSCHRSARADERGARGRALLPPQGPATFIRRALVGIAGAGLLTVLLASCGTSRSAAAVCHVWDTEGLALHKEYVKDGQALSQTQHFSVGSLTAIGDLISSPSQLGSLFSDMAAVAPQPIEHDFTNLADSYKNEQQNLGNALANPLGALGAGLIDGIGSMGSAQRVNNYLAAHCGIPGVSPPAGTKG